MDETAKKILVERFERLRTQHLRACEARLKNAAFMLPRTQKIGEKIMPKHGSKPIKKRPKPKK